MVTIRDMMPSFELYQPSTIEDALALLDQHGKDAWVMAGGKDSLNWFKDRIKRPKAVVELTGIAAMKGIRETADGIEIGALTTLTEIETNPLIQAKFRVLSDAVRKAASPQIRNAGTIGGNVAQDARCWYYQDGLPCYRAGGNTCFADTPAGQNREHALFNADRCVSVTPSDSAPALLVLEAKMVIRNSGGERVVEAEDFWIGPKIDITRMTVLKDDDILTAIRIPNTWAGAKAGRAQGRGNRRHRRQGCGSRGASFELQPLQDPVDGKPRQTGDPRRGVDFVRGTAARRTRCLWPGDPHRGLLGCPVGVRWCGGFVCARSRSLQGAPGA